MKRREFFKSIGALFLGASAPATMAMSSSARIPLPDGHSIAVDIADEGTIALIRAEIDASNKEALRQIRRDVDSTMRRWEGRYGP